MFKNLATLRNSSLYGFPFKLTGGRIRLSVAEPLMLGTGRDGAKSPWSSYMEVMIVKVAPRLKGNLLRNSNNIGYKHTLDKVASISKQWAPYKHGVNLSWMRIVTYRWNVAGRIYNAAGAWQIYEMIMTSHLIFKETLWVVSGARGLFSIFANRYTRKSSLYLCNPLQFITIRWQDILINIGHINGCQALWYFNFHFLTS